MPLHRRCRLEPTGRRSRQNERKPFASKSRGFIITSRSVSFGRVFLTARFGASLAIVTLAAVVLWGLFAPEHRLGRVGVFRVQGFDYDAFYCGGRVTGHGDPYELEPLATCERTLVKPALVLPVPLPPYDLAALHLQALPNERRARFIWIGLLLASIIAAAAFLQPVVGMPWPVLVGAVLLGNGRDELPLGQIVPFVLVGIAGAAYFLERGKASIAGVFALVTLVEPHLGVPVILGCVIFIPRARVAIGVGVVALAALSLRVAGVAGCLDYVRRVLPFHALAEAPFVYQFSMTYLLTMLHVPEHLAIGAGTLTFVAMLVAGLVVAGRLARKSGSTSFIALVPPAFVLLGGTFIKQQQLIVAIPLCFALLRLARARSEATWSFVTLFVVMLAWQPVFDVAKSDLEVLALSFVVATWSLLKFPAMKRIQYSVAVTAAYGVILGIEHMHFAGHVILATPSVQSFTREAQGNADLASYPWGVFMRTIPAYADLTIGFAIAKIVTWLGLGSMVFLTVRFTRDPFSTSAGETAIT